MREMVIALGLIKQGDDYLLQLRGDNPVIGGAGLIGWFGGKVENETPHAAVSREINEETTLKTELADFKAVGQVEIISDHKLETVKVYAHIFKISVPVGIKVEAREGKLVRLKLAEAKTMLDKMTTGTKAGFEKFVLKEK